MEKMIGKGSYGEVIRCKYHGTEVVPNVHPGRRMHARPEAIVGRAGYYQADTACPISAGTWEGVLAAAGPLPIPPLPIPGSFRKSC